MKTKVNNCGKYECAHCNSEGRCMVRSISLDQDGMCITFRKSAYKPTDRPAISNPMDEHTNMC